MSHSSTPHSGSCSHVLTSVTPSPARPHLLCQGKIQSERKSMENKGKPQSSGEQRRLAEAGALFRVAVISLQPLLHQICPQSSLHTSTFLCSICQHDNPNILPFSDMLLPTGLGCCCTPVILVYSDTKGWCGSTDSQRSWVTNLVVSWAEGAPSRGARLVSVDCHLSPHQLAGLQSPCLTSVVLFP